MVLSPKIVIYFAVANYLPKEKADALLNEIIAKQTLRDTTFLKIVGKYFDFKLMRDKPFVKEDIWIFNYLYYQCKKKDDFNPLKSGEEISLKGRLLKKGLIVKYENQIIIPQLKLLENAYEIINKIK
jgi:hypothetical protein